MFRCHNRSVQSVLCGILFLVTQSCARSTISEDPEGTDGGPSVVDAAVFVDAGAEAADSGLPSHDAGALDPDAGTTDAGPLVILDTDEDGIADEYDNCIEISNPDQANRDGDDLGDLCDDDADGDDVVDYEDNCPGVYNPLQENTHGGSFGDACRVPTCGDRVLNTYEGCDDGNLTNGDGCDQNCGVEPGYRCGSGTDPCTPYCGDGMVKAPEQCDPGMGSLDGCNELCRSEVGWLCIPVLNTCYPAPGDGRIVGDEECDDGNMTTGDGCSDKVVDVGFDCGNPPRPGRCETICGDGHQRGVEQCDDGNMEDGDGCSSACTLELAGFTCTGADPTICLTICGDGLKKGGEQCDDGNTEPDDGCSRECNLELGYSCGVSCTAICGDGLVRGNEQCDDGPISADQPGGPAGGDGCSQNCIREVGYTCSGEPSECDPVIGDGLILGDEECDDGNRSDLDGCSASGQLEAGYVCSVPGPACQVKPKFGDGLIVIGEACDDGNLESSDGCYLGQVEPGFECAHDETHNPVSACTAIFGDGYLAGEEECDDANLISGDGCFAGQIEEGFRCPAANQPCVAICGDGLWLGTEKCDDGNEDDDDGCSAACNIDYGYECAYPGSPVDAGPDGGADAGSTGQICAPIYGDGYVVPGVEFCDTGDDDLDESDGCVHGVVTPGYACDPAGGGCGPAYGDGYVLPGFEDCDDGNQTPGDGCSVTGTIEAGFTCYPITLVDGGTAGPDGLGTRSACSAASGFVCAGYETAQNQPEGAACTPVPAIGDNQLVADEQCDDGGNTGGDGCSASGQLEPGWSCQIGPPTSCTLIPDDGYIVQGIETCDDGNQVAGDGCTANQIDSGYECVGGTRTTGDDPSVCTVIFGDGFIVQSIEFCDDGKDEVLNLPVDGDGCSAGGTVEVGFVCTGGTNPNGTEPSLCTADEALGYRCVEGPAQFGADCTPVPIRGDGKIVGDESCDDGVDPNLQEPVSGDGCSTDGQLEPGWSCSGEPTECQLLDADGFIVSGVEQCDDKNTIPNDGCSNGQVDPGYRCVGGGDPFGFDPSVCTVVRGDGIVVGPDEECDDRNLNGGDGCSAAGKVETGYKCNLDTNGEGLLQSICTVVRGDGYIVPNRELCDDGPGTAAAPGTPVSNDGCSAEGLIEDGYRCTGGNEPSGINPSICTVVHDDGFVVIGVEQCDDKNRVSGDGCSDANQIESGYRCVGGARTDGTTPSVCTVIRGDGYVVLGREQCDDGIDINLGVPVSGDGCSANGLAEAGYECTGGSDPLGGDPSLCTVVNGDGFIVTGRESCDDKNQTLGDGCDDVGRVEDGFTCFGGTDPLGNQPSVCSVVHGDGKVRGTETCDDNNLSGGDGCNDTGQLEIGWSCDLSTEPTLCVGFEVRGDGYVVGDEVCDDGPGNVEQPGNPADGDGCSAVGLVEAGYRCTGGEAIDGSVPSTCQVIYGDGFVVDQIEFCDDKNQQSGDGCDELGVIEDGFECVGGTNPLGNDPSRCDGIRGDGKVRGTEECDDGADLRPGCDADGNVEDGYSCLTPGEDCINRADDGYINVAEGEVCDDGNAVAADGCTNGQEDFGYFCIAGCVTGATSKAQCDGVSLPNGSAPSVCFADIEAGFECSQTGEFSGAACLPRPDIGDGKLAGNERCDDSNENDGDGCSAAGQIEDGYECGVVGQLCTPDVGDGKRVGDEQCDDGNEQDDDGCSSTGQIEQGYICTALGHPCAPRIGDGQVVGNEECDDNNVEGGDGCSATGTVEAGYRCDVAGQPCAVVHGDGYIAGNETCDDRNVEDGDGCSGVGQVEAGYRCSGGNVPAGTNPSFCQVVYGDGFVVFGVEQCDDGNTDSGDGCDEAGGVEVGYDCTIGDDPNGTRPSVCDVTRGDGFVVLGHEQCDDKNVDPGDGCDPAGQIEAGYQCTGGANPAGTSPSVCTVVHGDGYVVSPFETCDDRNTNSGDGCDENGQTEVGYQCEGGLASNGSSPSTCLVIFGDGYVVTNVEQCDDGARNSGDGCDANGFVEAGYSCSGGTDPIGSSPSVCTVIYGDGYIVFGLEACDDKNAVDGDGCSAPGVVDNGYVCVGGTNPNGINPSFCSVKNGDGILVPGEEDCDDGNVFDGDGCSAVGEIEFGYECLQVGQLCTPDIGDGSTVGNEQCDDRNELNNDGCSGQGRIETGYECPTVGELCAPDVGDGFIVGNETCDDKNEESGDGCSALGQVEAGYECLGGDQPNGTNPSVCTVVRGDGFVVVGIEQCDDGVDATSGQPVSGDGCSATGVQEAGYECSGGSDPGGADASVCVVAVGDGFVVNGRESCDDKNTQAGDGCDEFGGIEDGFTCVGGTDPLGTQPSVCVAVFGDSKVRGAETCDDGNIDVGDGCDSAGQLEIGWDCDLSNEPTLCEGREVRGDGYVVGDELCDDGPGIVGQPGTPLNGDGCSASGLTELGYLCSGGDLADGSNPSLCEVVFGDGYVVSGVEFCDDKNRQPGDGCDAFGAIEDGYECLVSGQACTVIHGDGFVVGDEQCDDKNVVPADGCSPTGQIETGYVCVRGAQPDGSDPSVCSVVFGDGFVVANFEDCDDRNRLNNDGCSVDGKVEAGYTCPVAGEPCVAVCGDGLLRGGEACDDHNLFPNDGCSAACEIEDHFVCSGQGAGSCQPDCGDGFVVPNLEACDDHNRNNLDGCSAACTVEQGFSCVGLEDETSVCTAICGDGLIRGGEQCDDGTLAAHDGCDDSTCTPNNGYVCSGQGAGSCLPECGDGQKVGPEQCDDGNQDNADGCDGACEVEQGFTCPVAGQACTPICGDGVIRGDEVCDDGVLATGDGCDNVSCTPSAGYACVGQGPGSCQPERKLFVTTRTFKPLEGLGYGDIHERCKVDYGPEAFFCTRSQVRERVLANQADPSIFGKFGWVRDFDTFGGKPGNCADLTYNSGHQFRAHWIRVDGDGTVTDNEAVACNSPNWVGHCCLP